MLEPEKLSPPDRNGFFIHPDIPDDVLAWEGFFEENGYATALVKFVEDAPASLQDEFFKRFPSSYATVAEWTPTPPEGEGWQRVACYDTEKGPMALFARRAPTAGGILYTPNSLISAE